MSDRYVAVAADDDAPGHDEAPSAPVDDDATPHGPEPTHTSHPAGKTQAGANAENDPPG